MRQLTLILAALMCCGTSRTITAFALVNAGDTISQQRRRQRSSAAFGLSATAEDDVDEKKSSEKMKEQLEPLKLYIMEGGLCPYAQRTWITLLELGLPHDLVEVPAMKKPDWFLKQVNPRGKVPAIDNPNERNNGVGVVIYESAICDEYLVDFARQLEDGDGDTCTDDTSSHAFWKLMPVDAAGKAAMRLLNDHVDTVLGPAQYTYLMNDDKNKDEELKHALEDALEVLQQALKTNGGGPYLMGADFTLAESHVLPFFLRLVVSLDHFKGYQIPSDRFAPLLEWFDLCSQRESMRATSKSREQIIEVYQRFVDMKYAFGGLNKNRSSK